MGESSSMKVTCLFGVRIPESVFMVVVYGAVGTDERHDLVLFDMEGNVLERMDLP